MCVSVSIFTHPCAAGHACTAPKSGTRFAIGTPSFVPFPPLAPIRRKCLEYFLPNRPHVDHGSHKKICKWTRKNNNLDNDADKYSPQNCSKNRSSRKLISDHSFVTSRVFYIVVRGITGPFPPRGWPSPIIPPPPAPPRIGLLGLFLGLFYGLFFLSLPRLLLSRGYPRPGVGGWPLVVSPTPGGGGGLKRGLIAAPFQHTRRCKGCIPTYFLACLTPWAVWCRHHAFLCASYFRLLLCQTPQSVLWNFRPVFCSFRGHQSADGKAQSTDPKIQKGKDTVCSCALLPSKKIWLDSHILAFPRILQIWIFLVFEKSNVSYFQDNSLGLKWIFRLSLGMHVGGFGFLIRSQFILIKNLICFQPAVMRTKVLAKGRRATSLGTTGKHLFQGGSKNSSARWGDGELFAPKESGDIPYPYKIQLKRGQPDSIFTM